MLSGSGFEFIMPNPNNLLTKIDQTISNKKATRHRVAFLLEILDKYIVG